MDINQLLQLTIERKASDLHLIAGIAPYLRVEGVLYPVPNELILTPEFIEQAVRSVLTSEQAERFIVNKEMDFAHSYSDKARFRVNAYYQRGTPAVSFRLIPLIVPPIEQLGLPKIVHSLAQMRQGLALITGPTGHGKTTTLASILEEINQTRAEHIITIEDPVEFLLRPKKSIISQREMHKDTHSWEIALRAVLREDPNVVLIGEMRDHETISAALTIAETGHLVFATLHTNSAAQTIDRIVDVFPPGEKDQVKLQLSMVLEAVFSMRLVSDVDGKRVVAYEVLLATPAVKTAVREGKTHQIDSIIQTSGELGMESLESSMARLVRDGKITMDVARSWALRPDDLSRLVMGGR